MNLLEVTSLGVTSADGVPLVRDVSFTVAPGERLGLIGESGSGKSLTAFSIIGLLPAGLKASGSIVLDGTQVVGAPEKQLVPLRGRVGAFIFQEPLTALDPLMKLGKQVAEPIARHQGLRGSALKRAVLDALEEVHLPEPERIADSRSYEISGGQRQRVAMAMALACRPRLLIADEPTTALDVTVQSDVLDLLDRARGRPGHGHDLRQPRPGHRLAHDRPRPDDAGRRGDRARERQSAPGLTPATLHGGLRCERVRDGIRVRCGPRPEPRRMTPILRLDDVSFAYRGAQAGQHAVRDISFSIEPGQNTGLVGESGSGKTTLVRLLLGLLRPTTGHVVFDGVPLDLGNRAQMRTFRRSVQTVFQDPYSSLDPRQRVGRIVGEPVRSLRIAKGREADALVIGALRSVGLPADAASRYPHEFSGGQRQRIAIARAIVSRPRVLLADEPVSALDVITRGQVIDLLAELGEGRDLTVLMVSHDLGVVGALCQRTIVLKAGRIVEQGTTSGVLGAPSAAYTKQLLAAVPRLPQI